MPKMQVSMDSKETQPERMSTLQEEARPLVPEYKLNSEIGELYPVLLDAKGNLIDGFHRKKAKKNWHTIKLAQIKTKADLLTARIIANCQRLDHSEESKKWVEELATELTKEEHSDLPMAKRIADRTGMSRDWSSQKLSEKWKNPIQLKGAATKAKAKLVVATTSSPKENFYSDMPVEPPRVIREDEKGDWVLKQWDWVLGKIPETNAVNDLLPPQRKAVLRQLNTLQFQITAWIEAVNKAEVK